ncbi:temperature dependent protein affecting M2 dsRNA replication-domain-containing protein [Cercophora newfieldiana]|uniref:Temperature dependent protein affecting M2 dsRNA replication-domain-containing protein n=1 Tax=Cercophora newfieldiana TaxID=92897 RepID=A0AA40CWL3_9PEZI|nr:temperature dependent protein affecting M2 dsRNA replication-domain-containing protein [Cercophora newfieldiana]
MPSVADDPFINSQVVNHPIAELEDTAVAIDATYYLQLQLDAPPHEPLLSALAGLTGIEKRLEEDLDQWEMHKVIPFFIFDGQPLVGQDEVTNLKSREANKKTDFAWDLYFNSQANEAVAAFGQNTDAYRPQNLYPLLQSLLRKRNLHFLVPPFNASAQIAYFDMIDSAQCGAIMGPLELMMYPINDCIIRSIDWANGHVAAVSKKHIVKALNVNDSLFVDAFLMTGTSFLTPFPALSDPSLTKIQPFSISDAVNMLRAAEKSMTLACTTYNDVLKTQDPNWLDKYRKARMAVDHFIYITEDGKAQVHDENGLTKDNYEYLGLQLPAELLHYLNTGMIGPRVLSWITWSQVHVLPTLDGFAPDEYKDLVANKSSRIKEAALSLIIPRLNRGIAHKDITMKVWYDRNFTSTIWDRHEAKTDFTPQFASWVTPEADSIAANFPQFNHGSIISEVVALQNPKFAALTLADGKEKKKAKPIEPAGLIQSVCLWRFLHIREYVNSQHELTNWGKALAAALSALEPTVKKYPEVPHLFEQVLVAMELLRLDILNAKNQHEELRGLPMNGSPDDQASLLLISRCATLLKLRHQSNGYTGPLSKGLLVFRSLVSEVRSADRDLVEAILASIFLHAQAVRKRTDYWQLSHELPFLTDPDVAFGIAAKTYFDELGPNESDEFKAKKIKDFPGVYVPYATAFQEDLDIACKFFDALYAGLKTLGEKDIPKTDRATWDKAANYLAARR